MPILVRISKNVEKVGSYCLIGTETEPVVVYEVHQGLVLWLKPDSEFYMKAGYWCEKESCIKYRSAYIGSSVDANSEIRTKAERYKDYQIRKRKVMYERTRRLKYRALRDRYRLTNQQYSNLSKAGFTHSEWIVIQQLLQTKEFKNAYRKEAAGHLRDWLEWPRTPTPFTDYQWRRLGRETIDKTVRSKTELRTV